MEFYSVEAFEIVADAMEDFREWEDFETDMETNPYDDPDFPW